MTGRCEAFVSDGFVTRQCSRKVSIGTHCKIHSPEAKAKRRAKSDAHYKATFARQRIASDIGAVNRTADLLRASSRIGPAEACEALAKRLRDELRAADAKETTHV